MKPSTKGVHNGSLALNAKVEMRERVLELITPAHVFDAYCGPTGEMWSAVWNRAASYVGCDEVYVPFDPRRRFVGDNKRVMRAIDLSVYNVFDLDSFGHPWDQVLILAARRIWSRGERGAVILTWSDHSIRWGYASHALATIAGLKDRAVGPKAETSVMPMAVRGFFDRANVKPLAAWNARGKSRPGPRTGSYQMTYTAIVFEGLGAS